MNQLAASQEQFRDITLQPIGTLRGYDRIIYWFSTIREMEGVVYQHQDPRSSTPVHDSPSHGSGTASPNRKGGNAETRPRAENRRLGRRGLASASEEVNRKV